MIRITLHYFYNIGAVLRTEKELDCSKPIMSRTPLRVLKLCYLQNYSSWTRISYPRRSGTLPLT